MSKPFSTETSRFGLAVSAGFVVVAVGVLSVGFERAGRASGLFDLFGSGFLGQAFQQPRYAVEGGRAAYAEPVHRHRARHGSDVADGASGSGRLAGRSICVRLCDGYSFPVGPYHGERDRAAHEATCHSECPGAETALYVMPSGSDDIRDATRVGSGLNYSALPDAFHFSTVLDSACTCHPASGNRIKSLLHDFTLRRGDAVMTATGFKVFHGSGQFPYKRKDFVPLAHSRDIRTGQRATFAAIERASRAAPTTVAAKSQPTPAVSDRGTGTKMLEHQASR